MNDGAVIVAVVGVGVGMLAVLVPLLMTLGRRIADVAEVRRDLHAEATAIRAVLHTLAERVARIEGAMNPWRPPANGAPAPEAPA